MMDESKEQAMSETKVVINTCYGGFGLSEEATREYLRRTGQEWTEEPSKFRSLGVHFHVGNRLFSSYDIERSDPTLVELVEEWGDRADRDHASLKIETLPAGTPYRIGEYDGTEWIETRDGLDWATA